MGLFQLKSPFQPAGDQPRAIDTLTRGILEENQCHQVLMGVTGSGKTFTMANVIARVEKPTLVIAPNKTLAAQLYNEFRSLFPDNAVEYFVSYYDYYQPEAYIPTSDTYIQKDSSINEMIDKMRHSATRSVLARRDVVVVASVSCIYGLGAPEDYLALRVEIRENMEKPRDELLSELVNIQYKRSDIDFHRGTFRVRGDRVEIFPAYEENRALRIDFFGDLIESISETDPLKGDVINRIKGTAVFPASHYVTLSRTRKRAIQGITEELKERLDHFRNENMLLEAQRLEERTQYDLEMISEIGYCNGIENYSRHLTGRNPGEPPPTLLDYFPGDFLLFFDECHIAVPQIGAMYKGDRSRKETLVRYGFRLPSALDNRPLTFDEFTKKTATVVYVSATPADYEIGMANGRIAEQIVRPTGLLDPVVEIRKAATQVDDLYEEIMQRIRAEERVLVTTLTKRMAEDLTEYFSEFGIKVRYLHSDIGTVERIDIIQDLRKGVFDVLVGINLLREGLDIPEVSLVAVLDADKEGFLRSYRSLIQTFGRAARNVAGKVLLYADTETDSMKRAIRETRRRRRIQKAYNTRNKITPTTIVKEIRMFDYTMARTLLESGDAVMEEPMAYETQAESIEEIIQALTREMKQASAKLEFEKAAGIRDKIRELTRLRGM
jgi:excinuclease ABC subunit B